MKKSGLLHAELSRIVARAGHTDTVVLADVGLPVPPGVPCIDLAVSAGIPSLESVLRATLSELVLERATVALELKTRSPLLHARIFPLLGPVVDEVSHEQFKTLCLSALVVVRTGEATPYGNVMLHCGVNF